MDFPESKASLIAKQARSELLNWIVGFCELERGVTEDQRRVMEMKSPILSKQGRSASL